MKPSLKYAKNAKWVFFLFANTTLILHLVTSDSFAILPFIFLEILLILTTLGVEGIAIFLGTNFHREVKNPVDPEKLYPGQVCWLNGETRVKFVEKDENYGGYRFQIWGRDDFNDPNDHTHIDPWRVRKYISYGQED